MKFLEIPFDHPSRPIVSRFICATYLLNYNARVENLPKTLIAVVDKENKVHAAAGLRDASEPFFSEHYLDQTIDELLSDASGRRVERSSVVEVSCLASRTPAISAHFMRALVLHGEESRLRLGLLYGHEPPGEALEAHAPSPSQSRRGLRGSRSVAGELGLLLRNRS